MNNLFINNLFNTVLNVIHLLNPFHLIFFFKFFSNTVKNSDTFFLKGSTHLYHTCTTKDVFKGITTRFDTTSTNNLDFTPALFASRRGPCRRLR